MEHGNGNSKISELQAENTDLKKKGYSAVERMEQEIADLKAKNAELRKKLAFSNGAVEQINREYDELKSRWEKLKEQRMKGCGYLTFEGHYKCRKGNLCPVCEDFLTQIKEFESGGAMG